MAVAFAPAKDGAASAVSIYVDTCIWVALVAPEPNSPRLLQWLRTAPSLVSSDWTELEVWSAIGNKVRAGDLSPAQGRAAGDRAARVLREDARYLTVMPQDIAQATMRCADAASGLRAGDALHLALALRAGCTHFFSHDKVLRRNAESAGLRLIDV